MAANTLSFTRALVATNLKAALALRSAFVIQVVFMALNNLTFFVFWWALMRREGQPVRTSHMSPPVDGHVCCHAAKRPAKADGRHGPEITMARASPAWRRHLAA